LATSLARRFQAELHVLHVRRKVDVPNVDKDLLDEVERLLQSGDAKTMEMLDRFSKDVSEVPYQAHIEHRRSVSLAIVDMVTSLDCDLVAMGTHGRRGFKHLIMGSVAERVVRLCNVPVLTACEHVASFDSVPENILVAHDFSNHSLEAVRHAAAWARPVSADVTLLHAIQPLIYHDVYALEDYSGAVWERVIGRCHDALEKIAAEYLPGLRCTTAVVEAHPAQGISRYATEHDCDLVVLATRGLTGLEHAVVGSVAEQVVRQSSVPVLTVR
jgi:nucleotide-binding universal stress UspA family protein